MEEVPISRPPQQDKKERMGRWTAPEKYLFETLLQKYGKDWKKIGEHLKKRTLSQIRSHAQKYFEKIGKERVAELERRAKVIQAYEILSREKCFSAENSDNGMKMQAQVKKEEEGHQTSLGENSPTISSENSSNSSPKADESSQNSSQHHYTHRQAFNKDFPFGTSNFPIFNMPHGYNFLFPPCSIMQPSAFKQVQSSSLQCS